MPSQFIVYACPTGPLADQLAHYFEHSLRQCGRNAAHAYMPHCSLTGFFRDDETAAPLYRRAIAQALSQAPPCPDPVIAITGLHFRPDWHGLELQSDWLKQLIANFAQLSISCTRDEPLRLKTWLHLSLAYDFPTDRAAHLTHLAQTHIDPHAPVGWELRFYQRHPDHTWTCHQSWPL
ncbi:MAG TPA: hypothetical protein V6C88_11255 [Chroococcidiopsis sp.]